MATIYDVAKRAGVSPKTVSRVINREPNVRSSTLEAVQSAIMTLDYRPSTVARLMKSQRSNVIGFLTDHVVTSPESIDIARGVAERAQSAGITVLFVNHGDAEAPLTGTGLQSLIDLNVDGLIYAAHTHRQISLGGFKRKLPTVLANCFTLSGELTSVVPDDRYGGYMAGEMLIAAGHRDVAMLNLDAPSQAAPQRASGFCQAFTDAGLRQPQVVTAIGDKAGTWEEHDILPAVLDQVLSAPTRPTALFCGNDKMAMVVYGLLAERGIKIPDQISVVGFDDYNLITKLLRPQLSSIGIAYDQIGGRAFDELQRQIDAKMTGQVVTHQKILVPGSYAVRGSLIALKAHK